MFCQVSHPLMDRLTFFFHVAKIWKLTCHVDNEFDGWFNIWCAATCLNEDWSRCHLAECFVVLLKILQRTCGRRWNGDHAVWVERFSMMSVFKHLSGAVRLDTKDDRGLLATCCLGDRLHASETFCLRKIALLAGVLWPDKAMNATTVKKINLC